MKELVLKAIKFAKERMKNNHDGHDYYHAERVYKKAIHFAQKEGCNIFLTGLAAILHEIDNKDIVDADNNDCRIAREFLQQQSLDQKDIDFVCDIINFVSKRQSGHHMAKVKEAMCVHDANNLDAIGAIGIARAFAWGACHKQFMYEGDLSSESTIKYFYDFLLPLCDSMLTEEGQRLASERKDFIDSYIREFYYEWSL